MGQHRRMRAVAVSPFDGLDDAVVLGSGLDQPDVLERDAARLGLESRDGAQHQGKDPVAGDLGELAMEFQVGWHGLVERRAEALVGRPERGAFGRARSLSRGARDGWLHQKPRLSRSVRSGSSRASVAPTGACGLFTTRTPTPCFTSSNPWISIRWTASRRADRLTPRRADKARSGGNHGTERY